jgi:polar amino acid transport system substrate-binding protein
MPYRGILLSLTLVVFASVCLAAPSTLKLATLEYPPYIINSDHGAQGLAVDIVHAVFARIGQPVQIQFYPVSRGAMMLQTGHADGYFSVKKTTERQTQMRFTHEPLYRQEFVIFTRKHSP